MCNIVQWWESPTEFASKRTNAKPENAEQRQQTSMEVTQNEKLSPHFFHVCTSPGSRASSVEPGALRVVTIKRFKCAANWHRGLCWTSLCFTKSSVWGIILKAVVKVKRAYLKGSESRDTPTVNTEEITSWAATMVAFTKIYGWQWVPLTLWACYLCLLFRF